MAALIQAEYGYPYTTHNPAIMGCFSIVRMFYKRFMRGFV